MDTVGIFVGAMILVLALFSSGLFLGLSASLIYEKVYHLFPLTRLRKQ